MVKIWLGRKRERLHGRCNGASIERGDLRVVFVLHEARTTAHKRFQLLACCCCRMRCK